MGGVTICTDLVALYSFSQNLVHKIEYLRNLFILSFEFKVVPLH